MRFEQIAIEKLQESGVNPRQDLTEIRDLAQSIDAFGILQPLIVSKTKDRYTIVAGHRRAAAAAFIGLESVPCVVRETSPSDMPVAHLVENLNRVDLLPAETGAAVVQALAKGVKQKTLAETLGKSEAWVSKFATIGKALAKMSDKQKAESSIITTKNGDVAYDLACAALQRKKPEAPKQTTLVEQDEDYKKLKELMKESGSVSEFVDHGTIHFTMHFMSRKHMRDFMGIK